MVWLGVGTHRVTLGLVEGGDSQGDPWFGWGWRLTGYPLVWLGVGTHRVTLGLVGGGDSQGDPWFGWGCGLTG